MEHLALEPDGAAPVRRLLVWDAPNIDMALGKLLGGRTPRPQERPRFDVLARWLVDRSEPGELPEACVFTNISPDRVELVRGWIDFLRSSGFSVFAKPKTAEGDDIDRDLIAHLNRRAGEGRLAEVLLASADQFREYADGNLADLAGRLPLTVLGFREFNGRASRELDFIDLEDIPGLFEAPLIREVPLEMLPAEGAWLPARRSLRDIYG